MNINFKRLLTINKLNRVSINRYSTMFLNNYTLKYAFKQNNFNSIFKIQFKNVHFRKPNGDRPSVRLDNYSHHSPLNKATGKIDENRSRLFYQTPPVPNRLAKYLFFYCLMVCYFTGAFLKGIRLHCHFLLEKQNLLLKKIAPHNKALHELRFTAIEQKNFMIYKAVANQYNEVLFETINKRMLSKNERIHSNEITPGAFGMATKITNHGLDPTSTNQTSTMSDKGLFDNREVGYGK